MAPVISDFLANVTLSTSPQATFEQADDLLLQAVELTQEIDGLRAQIDVLVQRADILTATANGLQAIATQDRATIQARFGEAVDLHTDFTLIYGEATHQTSLFNSLEQRVEDGMATLEEVEDFVHELYTSQALERSERSKAPEPETPENVHFIIPSVEGVRPQKFTTIPAPSSTKRKPSNFNQADQPQSLKRAKHHCSPFNGLGGYEKSDPTTKPVELQADPEKPEGSLPNALENKTDDQLSSDQLGPDNRERLASVELGSRFLASTTPLLSKPCKSRGRSTSPLPDTIASSQTEAMSCQADEEKVETQLADTRKGDKVKKRKAASASKQRRKLLALANPTVVP